MADFTLKEIFEAYLKENGDLHPGITAEMMLECNHKTNRVRDYFFKDQFKYSDAGSIQVDGMPIKEVIDWLTNLYTKHGDTAEVSICSDYTLTVDARRDATINEAVQSYPSMLSAIAEDCEKELITKSEWKEEMEKLEKTIKDSKKRLEQLRKIAYEQ